MLVRRIARTLAERRLIGAGDRVLVALSGGPDSVALLLVLGELAARDGFTIAGALHVHHGLRGAEADRDEAFCRALGARLGVPVDVAHVDTRAAAAARRLSVEAAARELRYGALADAAAAFGATRIATGHTADDQAETVLLRLLHGASARGVSGIRPRRGAVVRPLIDCRRADVRAFLEAKGEPSCDDASNADASIPRNRLRRDLLPLIERLAPRGVPHLAQFADLAADDEACLSALAGEHAKTTELEGGGVQTDRAAIGGLPPALARRVVRAWLEQAGVRRVRLRHIESIRAFVTSNAVRGHLDLPGVAVEQDGARLTLRPRTRGPTPPFERPLAVPGAVDVPEAGVRVEAEILASDAGIELASGRYNEAVVSAGALTLPLTVRSRRPGDRYRPLGAPGRRKVKDVLIDRKVPRAVRDRTPIVADAAGRIVWVVNAGIAEGCRVTGPPMVVLKVKRLT